MSPNERLQTYVQEHNIVDIELQDTDNYHDNDDDDSSDDENEGDDIDENAFPDAGVFEGTLANIDGVGDQAIIDSWQVRLAEEDDDEYRSRMDSPPDDVIAAVTRLDNKRFGTRSGSSGSRSSGSRVEVLTTALQAAPAAVELSSVATGAIDLTVSNSRNVAMAPVDLTVSPPHSNQTYCQLTFESPQPAVVVIEESTEQETYRASEFSTFTVQEAWDKGNIARYYHTLSSHREFKFLWPRLTCMECTFPHHKPFIQIGDEDYMASITQTANWYDGVFIALFSQLAAHYAHITKDERSTTIPSQVNLPLLIHITYPNEFLQEGQYKSIPPDITRVVAVVHDRDHYGVLEIDIPSKKVIIYDGLYRDLDKWVDYVFSALKRCRLCNLRTTHLYAPDEPKLMTLGRLRHARMSIEG